MDYSADHALSIRESHRDAYFTIEPCQGETYAREDLSALYAHYEYERSSVLAGREARVFVTSFPNADADAVAAILSAAGLEVETWEGTSHRPISEVTAGLPGRDGYPEYGELDW